MHILLIGRWSGHPASDWYPWISRHVARLGATIDIPALPHPEEPKVGPWTVAVLDAFASLPADTPTLLIGHSVGNHAILRALATVKQPPKLLGAIFVAGWWTVDQVWPSLAPWTRHDEDLARARALLPSLTVLIADNDRLTSDYQSNALEWKRRMDCTVQIVKGAGHFNGPEQPAVLAALESVIAKSK
ncbi:MAG: alpha/beta hydrolase [Ignavibacteria bacterium]|nr:alpha/beta hydrolase [Ignavibacteria bacterium]